MMCSPCAATTIFQAKGITEWLEKRERVGTERERWGGRRSITGAFFLSGRRVCAESPSGLAVSDAHGALITRCWEPFLIISHLLNSLSLFFFEHLRRWRMEATDWLPDGSKQIISSSRIPPPFQEYLLNPQLHRQPLHWYNCKETAIETTKNKWICRTSQSFRVACSVLIFFVLTAQITNKALQYWPQ